MDKNIEKAKPQQNSEFPKELEEAVRQYFNEHVYDGYSKPFELEGLARSGLDSSIVHAIPKAIDEELSDDLEFSSGLAKLGERFGVYIRLPYYCYAK